MRVVLAHRPEITRCVSEMKAREPGATGRLVMRWKILRSGITTDISPQTEQFRDSHLARCLGEAVSTWRFPAHRMEGPPVDFPFEF